MPFSSSYPLWDSVPGLKSVKSTLSRFIQERRIPQAIILSGQPGIGKDFVSAAFAHILNSKSVLPENLFSAEYLLYVIPLPTGKNESNEDDPYSKLSDVASNEVFNGLALKKVNPYHQIKLSNPASVKISSIRSIAKYLSLRTFSGEVHRVVLISDAHRMGEPAQNALLKTLEEPPEQTTLILTTSRVEALKETIRSRCWEIKCPPLDSEDVVHILGKYFDIETAESRLTATFSHGSTVTASLLLSIDFENLLKNMVDFVRNCSVRRYYSAANILKPMELEQNSNMFVLFLNLLQLWFSDLDRYRLTGDVAYFTVGKSDFSKFLSGYPHVSGNEIIPFLDDLENKISRGNANLHICLLNLMIRVSEIITPLKH